MRVWGGVVAVGLLVAGSADTSAGARATTAEIVVSPTTVGPGGVVTATGNCSNSDVALLRAYLSADEPGAPFDFSRLVPLVFGSTFTAQVAVPSEAPPGTYTVGVGCFFLDIAGPTADAQLVITDEPAPPQRDDPTITVTSAVSTRDRALVTGSCPTSTPAADRVLIQDSVQSGDPSPQVFNTIASIDSTGRFTNLPLAEVADIAGPHALTLHCLADEVFLGTATTGYQAIDSTAPPTTTTTLKPTLPASPKGDPAPAIPLPATPTLTG